MILSCIFFTAALDSDAVSMYLIKKSRLPQRNAYDNLDMSTCSLHHTFTASNHIQSQWWCAWASGSDPWLRTIILIITIGSLSKHEALVGLVPTNQPRHSDVIGLIHILPSNPYFLFCLVVIALLICLIAIVRWHHRQLHWLTENHDNEFVSYLLEHGDVATQHRRVVLLSTFYTAACDSHFMTLCWFAPFPYACIQLRNARTTYITISHYDNLQARYLLLQSSPYSKMSMHVD